MSVCILITYHLFWKSLASILDDSRHVIPGLSGLLLGDVFDPFPDGGVVDFLPDDDDRLRPRSRIPGDTLSPLFGVAGGVDNLVGVEFDERLLLEENTKSHNSRILYKTDL